MEKRKITFSPPDITEREIAEVVDTLRSGWITTGPKTKKFENEIAEYCGTKKAVALNSATAAMELALRLFDIGEGDEVITSAYTYTASASVVYHCGAKIILADTKKGEFNIDPKEIEKLITPRTKAIIPVDIAGLPADYTEIFEVVEKKRNIFNAKKGTYQEKLGRILVLADSAHSFGSDYKEKKIGSVADITSFSFHAINALAKLKAGAWKYDIVMPGYKCNMTDIMASIGLVQLQRYDGEILKKKEELVFYYEKYLGDLTDKVELPIFKNDIKESCKHLYMIRLKNQDEEKRNEVIAKLGENDIATNVHFQPLPLLTAYKKLGFKIEDYPNAYNQYKNEISLPIHDFLTEDDIKYICEYIKKLI